jgi:hypothetical protein
VSQVLRALLALVVSLTLCSVESLAQSGGSTGELRGQVVDPSGSPVASASLQATDALKGVTRTVSAESDGAFRFPLLPPGTYTVSAESANFAKSTVENVVVRVGETNTLEPIKLALQGMNTAVTVSEEAAQVDATRTQQADAISQRQIMNLPVNRRSYLDLALLTPGVTETSTLVDGTDYRVVQAPQSGLSFGGGNGRTSSFSIDGVENSITSGGVRASLSQEAVAEFQVNRNSVSAEFGGGVGAAVNIVSRSGTNDWHGNLFGFLRHKNIQARNYFDPTKSAFTRTQAGATLGGPIQKDKTFFFAGYERLQRQETSFVTITQNPASFNQLKPSQSALFDFFSASGNAQLAGLATVARQQLIPANNPSVLRIFRENSGVFPFSEHSHIGSVRLDRTWNEKNTSFMRFNAGGGDSQNSQLGALSGFSRGRTINRTDATLMISHLWVPNERGVLEFRAMANRNIIDVTTVDPNGPGIEVAGFGTFGRDIFLPSRTREWHYQYMMNATFFLGRHTLKYGIDMNPVSIAVNSQTFFAGRFSFGEQVPLGQLLNTVSGNANLATQVSQILTAAGRQTLIPSLSEPITALQAYSLGLPSFYQQGFGDPKWNGNQFRFNYYIQDDFAVTPKLKLNLGVRYELEQNPAPLRVDRNNFAPIRPRAI